MTQTVTAAQVKGALYKKGVTLKSWCEQHDFKYRTALNAIERHAGGTARVPWGPLTRQILTALEEETGFKLLPN